MNGGRIDRPDVVSRLKVRSGGWPSHGDAGLDERPKVVVVLNAVSEIVGGSISLTGKFFIRLWARNKKGV